jgi:hypothetical protein
MGAYLSTLHCSQEGYLWSFLRACRPGGGESWSCSSVVFSDGSSDANTGILFVAAASRLP